MRKRSKVFWAITVNSLSFFIIAYLLLFFLQNLTLGTVASFFDISSRITHDTIVFILDESSWGFDSVKTTFSSSIVLMMILGTFSLIVYHNFKELTGVLKQLFFWSYLVSFTMVFGSILVGGFASTGFGHVLNWSYVRDTGKMLHVIVALVGLAVTGLIGLRASLFSSNTYFNTLNDDNRLRFFVHQYFYPFIIGSILFILIRIPIESKYEVYDIIVELSLIIPIIIMFLGIINYSELMFDEEKRIIKPRLTLIISALALVIIYRILLSFGLAI